MPVWIKGSLCLMADDVSFGSTLARDCGPCGDALMNGQFSPRHWALPHILFFIFFKGNVVTSQRFIRRVSK